MLWFLILTIVIVISLCRKILFPLKKCVRFSIEETPFKETSITSKDHYTLISIMERLHNLFEGKMPYFLIGGSLIGSIRYQNRMPWDDDIDIGIIQTDLSKFVSLDFASVGLGIKKVFFGYKVYDLKENRRQMLESNFPFVDVFTYDKVVEEKETFYQFTSQLARVKWPKERFPETVLFPLTKCQYGDMHLWCPADYISFLNQAYPEWDRIAYISGSHTGQFLFRNYSLPINEQTNTQITEYLRGL